MVVCSNLLNKHVSGTQGPSWFESGCSEDAKEGEADCAAVLASPYSYYPPKMSDEPDGKPHIPVAFFGLVYYSAILIWFIGIGRPSMTQRRLHWLPLLVVGMGLASSFYFIRIMYSVINEWCPWCMVTHGLNFIIAACIIWMWPRVKKGQPVHTKSNSTDQQIVIEQQPSVAMDASHPSGRLLFMTIVAIFITMYGELNLLGMKSWRKQAESSKTNYDQCLTVVNQFKKESEVLIRKWQKAPKQNITIRDDDPILHSPKDDRPSLTMVVFSDFECPSCGKFAKFSHDKILPMFDGQMRMVFKHYPIDQSCNPKAARTMHPQACTAAYMAEAARIAGGNEAFWKTHDLLFRNRHALKLGKITPDLLAPKIGVNADNLKAALKEIADDGSNATGGILSRIHEDIDQAKTCGIHGTPAVFLEGKKVDSLAVTEITFWNTIAAGFWKNAKLPRPRQTEPPVSQSTHQHIGE